MSELKFSNWQEPYLEALMETDQRKLAGLVEQAERVMLLRLNAVECGADRVEKLAIEDALSALVVLKRETAAYRRFQAEASSAIQFQVN